jgi:hypothetical protein
LRYPIQEEEVEYNEDFDDDDSMGSDGDGSQGQYDQNGNSKNGGGSRTYIMNDNGQYERIIRKRKRKSSD